MKKREKLDLIHKWYPKAITTIDSVNKIIDFVETELDLEPKQVEFQIKSGQKILVI